MNYNTHPCPVCSKDMAPVIYGFPTTHMVEMAQQDIIALGGTKMDKENPTHYCYSCGDPYRI
jgi:hypothetical protein